MLLTSCFVCWKNGACIILWRPMPACLCPQSLVLCILPFVLLQMARDHYYSSWPKGFGISLVPLVGETIITAVPRHTCACQRWSHPGDANVTSPWLLIDAVLWNACNVDYRSDCIMSRCMSWMQLTTRPRLLVWSDILSGSSGSVHADIAQQWVTQANACTTVILFTSKVFYCLIHDQVEQLVIPFQCALNCSTTCHCDNR